MSSKAERRELAQEAVVAAKYPGGVYPDKKLSYRVSKQLKLVLQMGDITNWHVNGENDAIVYAAEERMLGGYGVDGAIHKRVGRQLVKACAKFPQVCPNVRCPPGDARLIKGFGLPAQWCIHMVGPIYDMHSEEENARLLSLAYRKCLEAAVLVGAQYIVFCAISCGIYGYPFDDAAKISLQSIVEAPQGLSEIHFVLFNDEVYAAYHEEVESRFTHD